MAKITIIIAALLVWAGTILAAGGKNQGDTGTGETSTGEEAQGQADQSRAGRDDSVRVFDFINKGE
jgi:hypothetical protein